MPAASAGGVVDVIVVGAGLGGAAAAAELSATRSVVQIEREIIRGGEI